MRTIKAAQRMGFSLAEAAELLAAGGMAGQIGAKLADVEARIAELTSVAQTLRAALVAGCDDSLSCAERRCPATARQPGVVVG